VVARAPPKLAQGAAHILGESFDRLGARELAADAANQKKAQ